MSNYNDFDLDNSSDIFSYFDGLTEDKIAHAEVISFDFFDTLFSRPLADPEDAFDILGEKLNIKDFRARRQDAQTKAFRTMKKNNRKEITIADIYAEFSEKEHDSKVLCEAEYQLELSLVEPNPVIFSFFKRLIASGKKVVVTSDMYLPATFFKDALEKYGVTGIDVFSSADENATKRDTGELFDILIKKLKVLPDKVIHLGDNHTSDYVRPKEKGLEAFYYLSHYADTLSKGLPLSVSIAQGLVKHHSGCNVLDSYKSLGFIYGGTVAVGFLSWIIGKIKEHSIDHVLFLSRDGYIMKKMVEQDGSCNLVKSDYFYGSRTSLTLSTINDENFVEYLPFLLSGAEGLQPRELLERIGVTPPDESVMASFGLSANKVLTPELFPLMSQFLFAYRWQILQVCRRNRRGLYSYIKSVGIKAGDKIALVDVGWSGTTQEAFYTAIKDIIDVEIHGYYFCLANTEERKRRSRFLNMYAMYENANCDSTIVDAIYENRVVVELFFSAPHSSIIGYDVDPFEPIQDEGRGLSNTMSQCVAEICEGSLLFARKYKKFCEQLQFNLTPYELTNSMVELATTKKWNNFTSITTVSNFDAWGSSRLKALCAADYLGV
ncbi:HAD family hydrolase [Enterobacter roggenkampii]|uniref:Haloacid dehalogenase n=1 Tax=Enterobacter roggenkampii TaxID=1812935 RepID=A0ABD4R2S5_9ENTR|nr:hypothetical protein [Enterobacter roggenkampii]CAE6265456.1 hypothetical protein AI2704V1_2803 [Enterobacter cloacae]KTK04669.1 hypothetical protein ASU70_03625 [Enterobacter roggenkampii]MBU3753750.1 hypothetical protein [Enterobacter roggenkampii]MBU3761874.1 hypothetical protein [Enterobacter roggenkampii]MBU3765928.1 hypothetical protein [Enterobacter roggenkampii]